MAKPPSDNQPDRRLAPTDDENDNEQELERDRDVERNPGTAGVTTRPRIKPG